MRCPINSLPEFSIALYRQCRLSVSNKKFDQTIYYFCICQCAAPKRWRAFDGKMTQVDTQYTIRAKELRDLYSSINLHYLNQEERLDVLLTLKHTVKVGTLTLNPY